jgi:hypothetical protein
VQDEAEVVHHTLVGMARAPSLGLRFLTLENEGLRRFLVFVSRRTLLGSQFRRSGAGGWRCTPCYLGVQIGIIGPAPTVQLLDDSYREMPGRCRNHLKCIDLDHFTALVFCLSDLTLLNPNSRVDLEVRP